MKTIAIALLTCVCSLAWTLDVLPGDPAGQPAQGAGEPADQKFITLVLAVPPSSQPGQLSEAPPALQALIKQGWRISQCTTLGKTPDNAGYLVALVLDQSSGDHDTPSQAAASDAPGAATPVASAKPGTYHIAWDDGYDTVAVIGAPVGVRNPVSVTTKEKNGAAVVTYQATAYQDAEGTIHIDGRGAPLTGPQATAYSPDSFAIHTDGTVGIRDDHANDEKGVLITNAPGTPPGAGADAPAKGQSNL